MLAAKDPTPDTCDVNQGTCTGSGSMCMGDARVSVARLGVRRLRAVRTTRLCRWVNDLVEQPKREYKPQTPDNDISFVTYVNRP